MAHVSPDAITLIMKMKDYQEFARIVAKAEASPDDAGTFLDQQPKALKFEKADISKVTFVEQLNRLSVFDRNGKKTKIPEGKEQAQVFQAIKDQLGGVKTEEEADAWSVIQGPLFVLSVIGVVGGFFIWLTTICEPNYEASGRRSGMKQLLNWIGYKIGPMWMSIAVGSLAAFVLGLMIFLLVKRPMRQVLEYARA